MAMPKPIQNQGRPSPLSQLCILHIIPIYAKFRDFLPPNSAKFRNAPPYFRSIYFLSLINDFSSPPILTMMHVLCIMLFTYWTPLSKTSETVTVYKNRLLGWFIDCSDLLIDWFSYLVLIYRSIDF